MTYIMATLLFGLVLSLAAVAANPSPYFGALGLVMAAGMGCGILAGHGGTFLSLILLLIYLGGMLVVFAYSSALAAEPFPETWFSWPVMWTTVLYLLASLAFVMFNWNEWSINNWILVDEFGDVMLGYGDTEGVTSMYSDGFGYLLMAGLTLLLTLLVVLEVTRGASRGALRAV